MTKLRWKKKIIKSMTDIDTYEDSFLPVIEVLSEILDRREKVIKQFEDEGSQYVITKISDRGAKNFGKNPLLLIIQDCEKDALSYWTSLGLTPVSMKRLMSEKKEEEPQQKLSPLAQAIGSYAEKS